METVEDRRQLPLSTGLISPLFLGETSTPFHLHLPPEPLDVYPPAAGPHRPRESGLSFFP